jgi:hypothetical protein
MSKFYVGKKEVAIKLNEKGRVIGLLPEFIDDDPVPGYVQFMIAILVLIKTRDEKFQDYVNKRWEEISKT